MESTVRLSRYRAERPANDVRTMTRNASPRFMTTRWALVQRAGRPGGRDALSAVCQAYWYPVYAFIRNQGALPDEAEDITQGFFAGILEREDLAAVDPARGRFRNWLRTASLSHLNNV